MLIYEVNLEVDDDVKFKYAGWLTEHIRKMLEFKGFKAAHWYFRNPADEESGETGKTLWTIHYLVEDRASLDDYLTNHAASMRQEAEDKFGGGFKATRRVLNLLSVAGFPFEEAAERPS